ncbi:hypothetical protein KEM52_005950 [Ascosphaera acerosa]|nr:hypothetical protein KEM52_005950 [Ascosphaera acerosa]
MHVLQQHYPDLNLTDTTSKAQQEKANKRVTQLFLSELSKGGFDTTLLTRPELNPPTRRHSIQRFRRGQHRRNISDLSWSSHETDLPFGASATGEHVPSGLTRSATFNKHTTNTQEPFPDIPSTPRSFYNAHPEHEELGLPLGSPTPPIKRSRVGSGRSTSSIARIGIHPDSAISAINLATSSLTEESPPALQCSSPSAVSSPRMGNFSRRSSLLSLRSLRKAQAEAAAVAQVPSNTSNPTDGASLARFSTSTTLAEQSSAHTVDSHRLKKRRNIIKEIIDTEHRFTQDMTIVVELYMQTAPSCSGMTPENTKTLFGNADKVFAFSTRFQNELKDAARSVYVLPQSERYGGTSRADCRSPPASEATDACNATEVSDERDRLTTIGSTFVANVTGMEEVYADYLKNHEAANRTLDILQKREVVRLWLNECKELAVGLTDAWDLDSLLVKPVQRMLKYPLLLSELISVTPHDHPDYESLQNALKETKGISIRINESKKRADVVGQVINSTSRKRRESDVRSGLTKAFGWRSDKYKQQTERYSDQEFDVLANQFGENFFHTQLILRDVDDYIMQVQRQAMKFNQYIVAINNFVEMDETQGPGKPRLPERKWHKFAKTVRHFIERALGEHLNAIRRHVSQPMFQLLKLHEGPQRVMQKRNKRYIDYSRFRSMQDRRERPDRKTVELAEQFDALNVTLKEELPRLFKLSGKLMHELLTVLACLQTSWHREMQDHFAYVLTNASGLLPDEDLSLITAQWAHRFAPAEEAITRLSVCNGALVADNASGIGLVSRDLSRRSSMASTLVNPRPSLSTTSSSPQEVPQRTGRPRSSTTVPPSKIDLTMPLSNGSDKPGLYSCVSSYPSNTSSDNGSLLSVATSATPQLPPLNALGSSISVLKNMPLKSPSLHDLASQPLRAEAAPPQPTLANSHAHLLGAGVPMRSASTPPDMVEAVHRNAGAVATAATTATLRQSSPARGGSNAASILFIATARCPFDVDPKRTTDGHRYHSYRAGESFCVVGEHGDLWLAWSKHEPDRGVGWIWSKHFDRSAAA